MYDNNMKPNDAKAAKAKPQEEFLRQVLFMKDDEKVLAVFPFFHNISDNEYDMVIGNFFSEDDDIPPKHEFCLMHEAEFGWGWIHNQMINHLDIAELEDYDDFRNLLLTKNVIKSNFILNEE